ncbi:MAG: Fic family protein [Methanobacteriota archaeon]|nr:MAG: Fic family protein [Euryarchaeota archaeon]
MVRVRKRVIGGQEYYYLEHSVRVGGRVEKRERYLGRTMPRDLRSVRERFLADLRRERWHPALEAIRRAYSRDFRRSPPSARERNLEAFAVQFTYNTQRIEGSTLTLRETADLLVRRVTPAERPVGDVKEAEAHRAVFLSLLHERKDLALGMVLRWHHELFRATHPDIAGRIRRHQVAISGSRFVPPSPVEVDPLLREFFRWYDRAKDSMHPVELAGLAHLKFVTVHPFSDGNGRVARLLMNFVLHRRGLPMLDIPYSGRNRYHGALEQSQIRGEESIFLEWFLRRYVRENRRFVTEGGAVSATRKRRR